MRFKDIAIVSCGTLSPELNHLRAEGFLDTDLLYFTTPGLHENPKEEVYYEQDEKIHGGTLQPQC